MELEEDGGAQEAASAFAALGNYKDSPARAANLQEALARYTEELERVESQAEALSTALAAGEVLLSEGATPLDGETRVELQACVEAAAAVEVPLPETPAALLEVEEAADALTKFDCSALAERTAAAVAAYTESAARYALVDAPTAEFVADRLSRVPAIARVVIAGEGPVSAEAAADAAAAQAAGTDAADGEAAPAAVIPDDASGDAADTATPAATGGEDTADATTPGEAGEGTADMDGTEDAAPQDGAEDAPTPAADEPEDSAAPDEAGEGTADVDGTEDAAPQDGAEDAPTPAADEPEDSAAPDEAGEGTADVDGTEDAAPQDGAEDGPAPAAEEPEDSATPGEAGEGTADVDGTEDAAPQDGAEDVSAPAAEEPEGSATPGEAGEGTADVDGTEDATPQNGAEDAPTPAAEEPEDTATPDEAGEGTADMDGTEDAAPQNGAEDAPTPAADDTDDAIAPAADGTEGAGPNAPTGRVYFASTLVSEACVYLSDEALSASDAGCGGGVEIYATAEAAQQRDAELSAQEGVGAHMAAGTVVIRLSNSLSALEREELMAQVLDALTTSQPGEAVALEEMPQRLETLITVGESSFAVVDGKICYALTLVNDTEGLTVEFPRVRVTFYDAQGEAIASDETVRMALCPGQELAWASDVWNVEETPVSMQAELVTPRSRDFVDSVALCAPLEVRSATIGQDGGTATLVCEIYNPNDFDAPSAAVTILYRDGEGALVSGETSWCGGIPAGSSATFEMPLTPALVQDTFEVQASLG